jgi:hypothetical protein
VTGPGADERRIRRALDERGVSYAPQPPQRERDWLDDLMDEPAAPRPASQPGAEEKPAGERRWDWSRLRHWPYARPACGACAALMPWYRGQSAALAWGHVLTQARAEAGVGAAYVVAAVGLGVGVLWVGRRRSWFAWALLTCAFVGLVDMARLSDIVTFTTGASQ